MLSRFIPDRLSQWMAALVVGGILLTQALALALYHADHVRALKTAESGQAAQCLAGFAQVLGPGIAGAPADDDAPPDVPPRLRPATEPGGIRPAGWTPSPRPTTVRRHQISRASRRTRPASARWHASTGRHASSRRPASAPTGFPRFTCPIRGSGCIGETWRWKIRIWKTGFRRKALCRTGPS